MAESTLLAPPSGLVLPALVGKAGNRAAWGFIEFFTVHLCNTNTREAYSRAAASFLSCPA